MQIKKAKLSFSLSHSQSIKYYGFNKNKDSLFLFNKQIKHKKKDELSLEVINSS